MAESAEQVTGGDPNLAITADEIALYDRQIRLWGVQAQEHIRAANVLLVGIKGLGNEIAKNLVLAGIHSLTVADHEPVTGADLAAQFFVNEDDVGKNRAEAATVNIQRLNNRVKVKSLAKDICTLPDADASAFISKFEVVIATDQPFNKLVSINNACRSSSRRFYAAAAHGFYGFVFADLIRHEFVVERELSNIGTLLGPEAGSQTRSVVSVDIRTENGKRIERVTKEELYSPLNSASKCPLPPTIRNMRRRLRAVTPLLSCFRALWDMESRHGAIEPLSSTELREFITIATTKHAELGLSEDALTAQIIRKFVDNLGSQLAPITAILGGLVAQDVINVIGFREQPIQNLAVFDGESFQVPVYAMHEEGFGRESNGVSNGVSNGSSSTAVEPEVIVL